MRNICGLRRVDRVTNAIIRESYGCELSVLERIKRNVLNSSGIWRGWERKGWLRECIGQMWMVIGGEGDHREDGRLM